MSDMAFNRFEKKYILPKNLFSNIFTDMSQFLNKDEHSLSLSYYTICNIYYDTEDDEIIKRSISKPVFKEKLRLRCYCNGKDTDIAYLEIKKKLNGFVNKRRTKISLREAHQLIDDKVMPLKQSYHNTQVLNEIYHYVKDKKLIPKIVISYDRQAYTDKMNHNVRVTFDTNITSRRNDIFLARKDQDENILSSDYVLMEIKTNSSIPLWLTQILNRYDVYSSSFSKYGTEFYEHLIKNRKDDEKCLNPYLASPVLQ